MRLATINNSTRDGQLVVVNHQGTHYAEATAIAPTLQAALDDWTEHEDLAFEAMHAVTERVFDAFHRSHKTAMFELCVFRNLPDYRPGWIAMFETYSVPPESTKFKALDAALRERCTVVGPRRFEYQ